MLNLHDFSILGKVDSSKTVITPNEFFFKLKEANALTNIDYEKFKTIMNQKTTAIEPSKEWIEKEKDKQFQNLFKELWPNLYDRLHPPAAPVPPEPKTVQELIAELEKKRAIYDLIAMQDLEKHKASLAQNSLQSNYSNVYSSKYNDSLNICINGLNSNNPKIEISSSNPPPAPKIEENKSYPNIHTGYDFPYKTSKYLDRIVKSPYNTVDLQKETDLLKSIQNSQEKLKISHKLEKTTDLVDDIIEKVKVLQTEMKKKSASIKLQNDIDNLKRQHENLHRSSSSLSVHFDDDNHYHHHHHHHHHRKSRSKERLSSVRLSSDSSLDLYEKINPRSSILKPPKAIVSYRTPSVHKSPKRSSSRSRIHSSKSYVAPKVDCWNCNWKHDNNVY